MNKNAPAGNHARPNPARPNPARPNPARPNPLEGCPLAAAFAAIGGKWKLTLLYWLAHDDLHFAGLRGRAAPISPKVLAEQLRELEADGLLVRTPTGQIPAPVIYRLTEYGRTVAPIVEAVRVWGEGHLRRSSAERRSDGRGCGESLPQSPT